MHGCQDYIRDSTFCSLIHVARDLDDDVAPELRSHGVTSVEFGVLCQLMVTPGATPAQLARSCKVSPQHLSGVLARSEAAGHIERHGTRGRGRTTTLRISEQGRAVLEATRPIVQTAGHGRLTGSQHRQLQALLHRLRRLPGEADDVVVLVDDDGSPVGTAERLGVHTAETPLHLAFSTYLFDDAGRVLLTRRALHKATWAGVWTNAACGHLRPGEDAPQAARRRVPEELGTAPADLVMALPDFSYRAVDASGLVENELCPVMLGRIDPAAVRTDPDEVCETAWVQWEQLHRMAEQLPMLLSPCSVQQIAALGEDPWRLATHQAGQGTSW